MPAADENVENNIPDEYILEPLVEGDCIPVESKRTCELAVECWNLRNCLVEADSSYKIARRDLKHKDYTLKRVNTMMSTLQESLNNKDRLLKENQQQIESLQWKLEQERSSRRSIINKFSRVEHSNKDVEHKITSLEVENVTLKSQM
jgi:chromosome segregation ATPase